MRKPQYTRINSFEAIKKRQKERIMQVFLCQPWDKGQLLKDHNLLIAIHQAPEPCGCGACEVCRPKAENYQGAPV